MKLSVLLVDSVKHAIYNFDKYELPSTYINESGLYSLTMRSKMKGAREKAKAKKKHVKKKE